MWRRSGIHGSSVFLVAICHFLENYLHFCTLHHCRVFIQLFVIDERRRLTLCHKWCVHVVAFVQPIVCRISRWDNRPYFRYCIPRRCCTSSTFTTLSGTKLHLTQCIIGTRVPFDYRCSVKKKTVDFPAINMLYNYFKYVMRSLMYFLRNVY